MLKAGTILDDRYEIIDVVGTGGMSTVYRAKDERLKRFVAIKVLKSEYSNDQQFVSKFRAEAQSSAGLTHPNIVSVYDVCEDDGRYFIVMELVEGITLKEYINLNGRIGMAQAIDFSIQIASGLEAAHEHHVIHRDIKPQNIIVSKNGNLKVTDFGIAKAATSTTMSTTGIGSVHYISPEQARGGYSDERSDIYSLGITMYEMVTGKVPFEGDTNVAIALMHIQNDMIPPRQLYPDIYPSFEKIIMKASQKKPERRYLTAAALIADLKRVKSNPNIDIIVAPPTMTGIPTQKFTEEDMQKIKNGSAHKEYAANVQQPVQTPPVQPQYTGVQPGAPVNSQVTPDMSRIDALLNQNDDEIIAAIEGNQRPSSIKRVPDDDYDDDYDGYDERRGIKNAPRDKRRNRGYDDRRRYEDEDEEEATKLEKAVMIGGISAAIIIAVIVFVLVGRAAGWFDFGSAEKETTEKTTAVVEDDEDTTEDTEETAKVKMIDVEGLSEKAAEKDLKEAGLMNYQFVEENSTDVKEGYVISQNIEAGTDIAKDTQIIVTVSAGAAEVEVADVTGMDEDTAYNTIVNQGFKATRSYKFDDEVENGNVINTDPAAGTTAKAGDTIVLYISQGAEEKTVAVPDLYGSSESAARSALENNNLTVGNVSYEFNSDVAAGLVISQSVSAGTEAKEGTTVDFVVSNGAETKTYTGTVSGTISTADPMMAEISVTVSIYINDSAGYHLVTSTTSTGSSIAINGSVGALAYNNGTVSFTVVDAAGNDVSPLYSKDLTLSYADE